MHAVVPMLRVGVNAFCPKFKPWMVTDTAALEAALL